MIIIIVKVKSSDLVTNISMLIYFTTLSWSHGSILASAAFILTFLSLSVASNFLKARRKITEEPWTGVNNTVRHTKKNQFRL